MKIRNLLLIGLLTLFITGSCSKNDEPQQGPIVIKGNEATINLDDFANTAAVAAAIMDANAQGVVNYKLNGNFDKLGIYADLFAEVYTNPFMDTLVETIDFSNVTNWPQKIQMTKTTFYENTHGVPAGAFSENVHFLSRYPFLRQIILPEQVKCIGYRAFERLRIDKLSAVGVKTVGEWAFGLCLIKEIDMPAIETILYAAFLGCSYLTKIDWPMVATVEDLAFSCCGLKELTMQQVTKLPDRVFESASRLEKLSFPNLKELGRNLFLSCHNIKEVNFPEVQIVRANVFWGNLKLKEIYLPKATIIEGGAFSLCEALEKIMLPAAVTIGENAFAESRNLTTLELTASDAISLRGYGTYYYGFPTTNCDLVLNSNKQSQVTSGKIWRGVHWKSITFE